MGTRSYIEDSGVGSRWEFDKKTLFGLVDHVTRISQDIADIAKVKNRLEFCADAMQNEIKISGVLLLRLSTSSKTCSVIGCAQTLPTLRKWTS